MSSGALLGLRQRRCIESPPELYQQYLTAVPLYYLLLNLLPYLPVLFSPFLLITHTLLSFLDFISYPGDC
jgi:hypothetical protein